jgi:hypothetical protein
MHVSDIVTLSLKSAQQTMQMFLGDLSDADFQVRPVPTANNIAWQIAHLCVAEKLLLGDQLPGVKYPEIPEGINTLGNERTGKVDPAGGYLTKAQYVECCESLRNATLAAVAKLSDSDFDKPNTNMVAKHAPTLGALLVLVANHTLMHAGQFTVVRRAINKPVVM